MDKKSPNEEYSCQGNVEGVVTARKCDCCGHHEIGITTQTGEYIPLRPGMRLLLLGNNST